MVADIIAIADIIVVERVDVVADIAAIGYVIMSVAPVDAPVGGLGNRG